MDAGAVRDGSHRRVRGSGQEPMLALKEGGYDWLLYWCASSLIRSSLSFLCCVLSWPVSP